MTNLNDLSTFEQPHRASRVVKCDCEDADCGHRAGGCNNPAVAKATVYGLSENLCQECLTGAKARNIPFTDVVPLSSTVQACNNFRHPSAVTAPFSVCVCSRPKSEHQTESFDCPAAPLDPDTTEIGQDETLPVPEGAFIELDDDEIKVRHERLDPYDEMVDRLAVERDMIERGVQQDMSALGRDLFEFAVGLSRAEAKGEL